MMGGNTFLQNPNLLGKSAFLIPQYSQGGRGYVPENVDWWSTLAAFLATPTAFMTVGRNKRVDFHF